MGELTQLLKAPAQSFVLNGHRVAYAVYGHPERNRPIFYLHGFPGSRLEGALLHEIAIEQGRAVISLDRPGFGESESYAGRSFTNFPEILGAVADQLKIDQFSILALSGGSPYGLATACALPDRVQALAIVSGMGPWEGKQTLSGMCLPNRATLVLARYLPWLGKLTAQTLGWWWQKDPRAMVLWLRAVVTADDKRILSDRAVQRLLFENVRLGLVQGGKSGADEVALLSHPWNLPLEQIRVPTSFWHGLADRYVPPSFAETLCRRIPGATLKLLPDRGHFMAIELGREILQTLP